jgi:HPt (histidine-containing phosphotransfer) domain-containing protein
MGTLFNLMLGFSMEVDKTDIEELSGSLRKYILHAAYGSAVLEAHRLENSLALLLAKKLVDQKHNFDDQFQKIKKLTLGRLIERVLKEFQIPEHWQEELDNALWFRNRLIHEISEHASFVLLKDGDVTRLVEELSDIYGYFKDTSEYVYGLVFSWFGERGLEKDKILIIVREMIENARRMSA